MVIHGASGCRAGVALVVLSVLLSDAAASPVHVRAKTGKWLTLRARRMERGVTLTVDPRKTGCANTTVVLTKPDWMVLGDTEPPRVIWATAGGRPVDLRVGARPLCLAHSPVTLTFGVRDDANPVDPASVRLSLTPAVRGVTLDTSRLGPPRASGRLTVRVPELAAGRYSARLDFADLSPAGNAATLTFDILMTGVSVSPDLQEIRIATSAGGFVFRPRDSSTLQIGDGPAAYLTSRVAGQHMYIAKVIATRTLVETPEATLVRVSAEPGQTDRGEDGARLARLEYDLEVREGLPCLLVTSRTVNLGAPTDLYCWWGWLPGDGYVTPRGIQRWSGEYRDIGKVGWVYLPPASPGSPGVGWLSPGLFGESRFGTMLLYTDPRTIATGTNGAVELRFGIMPARSAAEVARAAAAIARLRPWG